MKLLFFTILIFSHLALANQTPIQIGGKVFTEQSILVDILKNYLEAKSYKVETKKNLGGTFVAYEALKQGGIDLYVEYTGTAYHTLFKQIDVKDKASTYKWLTKAFEDEDILILKDLGFSNSYGLIVDQNFKAKEISDLVNLSGNLKIGFEHEVLSRPDGYKNLIVKYNLKFKSMNTLNVGLMYEALKSKQLDVGFGYSTDGRNVAYNLKILNDDLGFFPKYYASVIIRKSTLEKYPNLLNDLNKLSQSITDEEMTHMNYMVDVKKRSSSRVAKEFLNNKKLIVWSKNKIQKNMFGFRYEELRTLRIKFIEHLKICSIGFLLTLILGFLFGILAFEFKFLRPIIFAFINVFQTVPSLALLGLLIPFLGIGFLPSLVALVIYSLLPLVHNVFVGLDQVDNDIIESCKAIGMTKLQILFKVRIPIAVPTIGAGLRTSAVLIIGTATVAAFIGAGGLGELIFQGISSLNHRLIILGAVPAALLAFVADFFILKFSLFITSDGIKKN
jgi:osmoprotectant transport system permease protein